MKRWLLPMMTFAALLTLSLAAPTARGGEPDEQVRVEFNRDIRPILSDKCFTCHGPDEKKRKAKLRLDSADSVFAKRTGSPILVAHKPAESELYKRVISTDPDEKMPPAEFGKKLTSAEVALIKRWIDEGGEYQGHWSFVAPTRPAVPKVADAKWVASPIDAFILAKLEGANQKPAAPADRRTLIRRLSFDLTGLPPTPAEVEAFVNDKSPRAVETLIDRLLESPHFGERMAMYWLDVVRYADSIGYHSDNPREVWLYRDYVINAFNSNKHFDTFTVEQLAGDLLPGATTEQRIASGYNLLLQTTEEGGAQAKEYMAKYVADRVRNVSSTWMGVTMGCCECHNHKYDPFTQKDFYSFGAFFADIQEPAVGRRPQTPVPTPELQAKLEDLGKQVAAVEQEIAKATASLGPAQAAWEATLTEQLAKSEPTDHAWIDDQKIPDGGQKNGDWVYVTKEQGPVLSGSQSRRQTGPELVQHFIINAKETITLKEGDTLFAYVYLDPKNPPQQVMLQFNDGQWEHRAWWGADKIPFGGNGTNGPNHKKVGDLPKAGEWVRLEVSPAEVGLKAGSVINGFAFTQWGGLAYWDKAGVNSTGVDLPAPLVAILKLPAEQRSKEHAAALAKHYQSIAPELTTLRDKLAKVQQERDAVNKAMPQTLITVSTAPRMMRILPRGNWLDDSGKEVTPAVPDTLPDLVTEGRATRLDLAHWLVSRENPLTARVFVNRLWMLYFGEGLARSLDDFGSQGQWPTHPKLLDWLAVDFMDSGWDVKRMVKLMLMSSAYQQSSNATPALRQLDPYNKLLARQGSFRIDAEFVRDNALSVSGLLVDRVGGPSVYPYQPDGYWMHLNFPRRDWPTSKDDGLYRRGLYTHWQRSFLHPAMLAFDAPSREECTVQRPRSNTPLQALVLLNDPQFVESARAFGARILREGGNDAASRVTFAYLLALQRKPTAHELSVLTEMGKSHHEHYKADVAAAKELLAIGEKPEPSELDPAEHAAWTNVARTILNLHETMTRY